jgi:hypothetical protein
VQGVIVFVYKQTTFGYSISQRPKKKKHFILRGKKEEKETNFFIRV